MRHVQGSQLNHFVQGLDGFTLGYTGRKMRRYANRRAKKLGIQRSDLPSWITFDGIPD